MVYFLCWNLFRLLFYSLLIRSPTLAMQQREIMHQSIKDSEKRKTEA